MRCIIWLLGYSPLSDGRAPLSTSFAWTVGLVFIATDLAVMVFLIAQKKKQIEILSGNSANSDRL